MRTKSSLLVSMAFVFAAGCAPRREASEPKGPPARLAAARIARPAQPAAAASATATARESHDVSNYVRIDEATLQKLTGERRAELFATVPIDAFVYADTNLDETTAEQIRGSYLADPFPRRDEPLLLLRRIGDRPVVTTADGAEVAVDWARLAEQPASKPVIASAPRAVEAFPGAAAVKASALASANADSQWVTRALQPLARAVGAELGSAAFFQTLERTKSLLIAARVANDACRERASAPYDKRARAGTWTSTAPSGRTITVKSPRALEAEDQGVEHSDKACGDRAAVSKKLAAIYDAEEARIRTGLATERAKHYERATARFR